MKSRRACREAALQVLYQCDVLADYSEETVSFFFEHFRSQSDLSEDERLQAHSDYSQQLVSGVASTNWSVSRMACVDRNIIRIATYEMLFSSEVPRKVCINEAIEISKRFSADESPKFINGVLDKVAELIG
jgi:N utilization substance protein B